MDHAKTFSSRIAVLFAILSWLLAPSSPAAPLTIVNVGAPAVNCKFDSDCKITVTDSATHFTLTATSGDAFLQSRTFPVGEAGTAAAGLYAYLYRIDLRQLAGLTALPCVHSLKITFGPVKSLDYNSDGTSDQVFVVTAGGLGSVAPSAADKVGNDITFSFNPPVCAGSSPGSGQSSYFFGLTSARADRTVTATLHDTLGGSTALNARAPKLLTIVWPLPPWLFAVAAVVVMTAIGAYLFKKRRAPRRR
ncbi:MAG: hypothetical protein HY942_01815 [Gammaproteobacteria bacterium]|nr:hypothetical protein [Gammaproteobacteria bacterium]